MYKRILGVSAVGFAGFTYQADPKDYAYKRPILFWGILAPIFARYKYVEYITKDLSDEDQAERFRELHVKYAPTVLELFFNLRGLFIKLGQVACSREDILPKEYRDVFKVLLDHAPHVEGQEAYDLVEKSLNRKITDVFTRFDSKPLGSASIGQVHAATLHNGQEVVVKVQFQETKRAFDLDFVNGRFFARIAKPDQLPFMDEFEKQFKMEFDFGREARMLERVGKNIHPHFNNVKIPKPFLDYCTPTCIVMERFYGSKLIDGFKFRMEDNARKMGYLNFDDMKANLKEPNGKMFYRAARLYFLRGVDLLKHIYNKSFGCIFPKFYLDKWHSIDADSIIKTIFKVHGHQIFVDGCFNADPHIGHLF
eukprot:NODE_989_length_2510_cov_0.196429.p1 type:complete len:366 gc:universal NODE_989_length_2510_cov_0.196429:661-1758(+)